jgi:uncharacterized protein YraI
MRRIGWFSLLIVLLAGFAAASAQDVCQTIYQQGIESLMNHCLVAASGTACWAAGTVTMQTTSGQSAAEVGATVPLPGVISLSTAKAEEWSLALLSVPVSSAGNATSTLVVFSPVTLTFDQTAADLPPGAAFTLVGGPEPPVCDGLPLPGLLVQSPEKNFAFLRVNGVDLTINGTAVLQATDANSLTVSAITRETYVGRTDSVIVRAGYSVQIVQGTVSIVAPYDPAAVAHLPTEILPHIEIVPLPGDALVRQQESLHLRPESSAYTGTVIQVGLPVSVLGQNSGGDWLHIRTYDGLTGWVPRAALELNVPVTPPVYDTAPLPPLRPFGPVQAQGVTTSENNNLRAGPGQTYEVVGHLPLNSELNIYARSPDDEWLLVETADGVQAWISITIIKPTTPFTFTDLPYSPDFPRQP